MICVLSLQVEAQSTVDDSAATSCESSALNEAVSVIREELKDVRLIRADLNDVKSACASNQQQSTSHAIREYTVERVQVTLLIKRPRPFW